jgi:hypothetical protein
MKKTVIAAGLILLISGCSTPAKNNFLPQAKTILGDSPCYQLLEKGGLGTYTHSAWAPGGKAVMAISKHGNMNVCGTATNNYREISDGVLAGGLTVTWEKIEQLAIARCEDLRRRSTSLRETCQVFSRNYELVYQSQGRTEDLK